MNMEQYLDISIRQGSIDEWIGLHNNGSSKEIRDLKSADIIIYPYYEDYDIFEDENDPEEQPASNAYLFLAFASKKLPKSNIHLTDNKNVFSLESSNTITLGKMFIKNALIPIIVGIISNFCYDELKKEATNQEHSPSAKVDDNKSVEFSIYEDDGKGSIIKYHYNGPVKNVKDITNEIKSFSKK